jgi:hypothetical protein
MRSSIINENEVVFEDILDEEVVINGEKINEDLVINNVFDFCNVVNVEN